MCVCMYLVKSIGVNPAGDTGDVSPPENWTAGDGNALCLPPKLSF